MSDKDKDSGDKTELPTPKKLKDARKKGDIAKSKDVGAAFSTVTFCLLFAVAAGYCCLLIGQFALAMLSQATSMPFDAALDQLGHRALWLFIGLSAMLLGPMAVIGMLVEFFQAGPVMTGEKMKPTLDKLNPVEGLKRMFGKDGLVEMVKTLLKVAALVSIVILIFFGAIGEVGGIVRQALWTEQVGAGQMAGARTLDLFYSITLQLLMWSAFLFLFIALLDRIYSKHQFIKKMKMSRRDIKQEYKDDEGDPMVKSHRRQLHQEWADSNAAQASGSAAALLVNPTHIAIALDYNEDDTPVPVIAAKGQGPLAQLMRDNARDNDVPIIRNIAAARKLWARGETGEIIPEDMFDAIAEIILWARKAKAGQAPMEQELGGDVMAFEQDEYSDEPREDNHRAMEA
ncbi:EscU/YscU/HrcU family type III secretion system export apparatus switch protein [Parasphingorhabdus cellanae]|uniref:EscU/YscU/HrcU family type III secretion system export apparatus switch protein n=1 Tax=Parasphingorhabdus cellanae TaxID=2806553 RepID=A0ABX7T3L7_9SPHN|nr:EscU/YscU/HrcU family type III secretion system export apparatus switch protein [Parasphingorhabdus cellanae]QTD56131.1 EscU/YscU/HrcU family type III secretion system export apparatus switch protein [Parasphingorhabdus cellanae]